MFGPLSLSPWCMIEIGETVGPGESAVVLEELERLRSLCDVTHPRTMLAKRRPLPSMQSALPTTLYLLSRKIAGQALALVKHAQGS